MSPKHQILVFGEKVFGGVKPQFSLGYCEIEVLGFPKETISFPQLSNYSLVILDYSAFYSGGSIFQAQQEVFEKQMLEALDKGTNFCILHYDEEIPTNFNNPAQGKLLCLERQIGFRWLLHLYEEEFTLTRSQAPIIYASTKRNEFKTYFDRWGASKNAFKPIYGQQFEDVIYLAQDNGYILGFSSSFRKGKIIFLPCQRDFGRPESIQQCLQVLIESTLTYLTRSSEEIPDWAVTPIFPIEVKLQSELRELQSKVKTLEDELEPYRVAKTISFLAEYKFEEAVPKFFQTHFQFDIVREERFQEDFWILNESTKIVIVETKSHVRGLTKGDIYSLYNHRESNGFEETFPALLVANVHRNANSWKDKIRKVDKQDYEVAVQNNKNIVRIEDLLFFWNLIVEGQKTSSDLLDYFLHEKGWMEVTQDGTITIHK